MSYVAVADLRPTTTQPIHGARWPDLKVTVDESANSPLTQVISDASDYFDLLTGDHWASVAYTYASGSPPNYGLLVLDGPRPSAFGKGSKLVFPPYRISTITNVYFLPPTGTPVLVPTTAYAVHSSLAQSFDYDGVELLQDIPYASGVGTTWPTLPRSIGLEGTFNHTAVPEDVARATAMLVVDMVKTSNVPSRAEQYNSGRASFRITSDQHRDYPQPTGIPYVDMIVAQRRRKTWLEPV